MSEDKPTVRAWVLLKPWTLKRDGIDKRLVPGDLAPEFEKYPNQETWIARGFVKRLDIPVPDSLVESLLDAATSPKSKKKAA